jgi:hypothetical protein
MGNRMFSILLLALVGGIAGFAGLMAADASAARYTVTQCGWHVGMDATWADTSADKFTRSSYCAAPASADPFENVHMVSQTRNASDTVGGTRFARWRWSAPPGTGIVTVEGQRWHYLNDGFQHRLGGVSTGGNFTPFAQFNSTDSVKRDFRSSFSPFAAAFESRLLCAKADDRVCSANPNSVAGVRGVRLTLDDSHKPSVHYSGALAGNGWLRGTQSLQFVAADFGAGLRYSLTSVDGSLHAINEHSCHKTLLAGQWHATKMRPCGDAATGTHVVVTTDLSDGPHQLRHCAVDFASNSTCTADDLIRVDNNSPAAPRAFRVTGGDGWRRENGFRVEWQEPAQGVAAPIASYIYRLTGPGVDPKDVWNVGRGSLDGIRVPGPGEYEISLWLVDQAYNSNRAADARATLRFDDVPPEAYFVEPAKESPDLLVARLSDEHSGPAGGSIVFRRRGSADWRRIDTEFGSDQKGHYLRATFPRKDLLPGIYEFEVRASDAAGNLVKSGLRENGSAFTIEILPPPPPPPAPVKTGTALTARLVGDGERTLSLRVPFGGSARVEGRLTGPAGNGLSGQPVRIVQRPVKGSKAKTVTTVARTDADGYFSERAAAGSSRNVFVRFDESARHLEAVVGPLELRVKGSLRFRARPRRLATGRKVIFKGRVNMRWAARPAPANVVAIQYFEREARRWRPVLVTKTDQLGRFRRAYRFRYVTRPTRIRLRAVLLPSAGFPHESAASRGRTILVDGRGRR